MMHEMSLAQSIRGIVEDQARAQHFSRVKVVRMEIGRFAGVEKTALAFCFDVAMQGGPAEGARLEMIDLPGRAACLGCGEMVEIADRLDPCPLCGSGQILPRGGDEMRIRNLEVE